jgi:hypothetical protein
MKASYAISLGLGLGGLLVGGFTLGYVFHMRGAQERFAREADRTPSEYTWTMTWKQYPGDSLSTPLVLAVPEPGSTASRDAWSRWRWWEVTECDPDAHQLIWRFKADRWELVDDLAKDLSVDPFPEAEPGS